MDYVLHIFTIIGIYVSLAVSLELAAGQAGLLSIAHAAIYGIGAYTTAILAVHAGIPVAGSLACAMIVAAAASIPLGAAANRLRGDSFVLVTLGFQALATSVFENWVGLTGGPLGISDVPHFVIGIGTSHKNLEFACLALGLAAFTLLVSHRLSRGPFGRLLHCIRDDELVAMSLGKEIRRTKFQVLAVSSAVAGAAGGLYAAYATFVDPYSFTINESIAIAAMAIIGGLRTRLGPALGATTLVLLPEGLRFLGLPQSVAAPLQQVIYGGGLIWIVMTRPQGIFSITHRGVIRKLKKTGANN